MKLLGFIWALPTTLIGLILGFGSVWGGHGTWGRKEDWVFEFIGGIYNNLSGNFGATTFGFATLAISQAEIELVREHERIHTKQSMYLGPLFLPAYGLASMWSRIRYGNWYWNNWFEQQARKLTGV